MNSVTNNVRYKNQAFDIHFIQKSHSKPNAIYQKTGYFTNTSNRSTAKTRLTLAGIPREISKQKTRHISMSDEIYIQKDLMEKNMSFAIYGHLTSDFSQNMTPVSKKCTR